MVKITRKSLVYLLGFVYKLSRIQLLTFVQHFKKLPTNQTNYILARNFKTAIAIACCIHYAFIVESLPPARWLLYNGDYLD